MATLTCGIALLLSSLAMAGGQGDLQQSPAAAGVVPGLFGPLPATPDDEPLPQAFFLEQAPLMSEASGSATVMTEMASGSSLEYLGETTDDFGREWSIVAYPWKMQRYRQEFLAPFSKQEYSRVSGTTAVLVAPASLTAAAAPGAATASRPAAPSGSSPSWWTRVVALGPEYDLEFGDLVAVGAQTVPMAAAEEAIEILGGAEALGGWPSEPIAGQLHVPDVLPLLFRWNGSSWRLIEPVQFLEPSFGLLGNPTMELDRSRPERPGGFEVPCWRLVGALDARGAIAGSVEVAPAVEPPDVEEDAWNPDSRTGLRNLTPVIWPTVSVSTETPPRVFAAGARRGILLRDDARRQAVYLQQDLGPEITDKLRGRELTLDVWARTPPNATASAAVGIDVEVGGERFSAGGTVSTSSTLVSVTFTVPEDAEWLTVRLLPLDTSLAVEQSGAAIFERAVLRLSTWPQVLDPSMIPLYRVQVFSYRPVHAYTRTPLAPTHRPIEEIERIWERVLASDWSLEDKQMVIAGRVRVGMTTEQVGLSWGEPDATALAGDVPGLELRWDYEDRSAAFAGGELVSWSVRVPPPEVEAAMRCPCTETAPERPPAEQTESGGGGDKR
jgi:hypothetical protein